MRFSRFHRFNGRACRVRNSGRMYSQKALDGQTVLVVGPGWLGSAAASALADAGARVWSLRRGGASAVSAGVASDSPSPGPTPLHGDIRDANPWAVALPPIVDHIVVCVAPSRASGDSHASTYPAALRGALALAAQRGARSLVYTSSTGVYGRTDGEVSRETDNILVRDERQGALLEAERALQDTTQAGGVGRTILRVAGLYGPSRDPAGRFSAVVPSGPDDVWCNFAWRDDVVSAIQHCVQQPAAAGTVRVFNCADGVPIRASHIARALGAVPATPSPPGAPRVQPNGRSNQRILTEALQATGWRPVMANVFEGLTALGHAVVPVAITGDAS